jgi:hypothetical protein
VWGAPTTRLIGIDAVQREGVKVHIQVERGAEALDDGDGAALLRRDAPFLACTPTKLRERRADEGAQRLAREPCVVQTAVTERVGERQHPLADRHLGQHAVEEMRCRIRHPASSARSAEAAALAREYDQAIVARCAAVEAQEAMRESAAAEEGAKLLLDEARVYVGKTFWTRTTLC